MKHIKLYEEFVNNAPTAEVVYQDTIKKYQYISEANAKVEKTAHGDAAIVWNGKQITFSIDEKTLDAVVNALEKLKSTNDGKLNYSVIKSQKSNIYGYGDIYIEREPGSKIFTLYQAIDYGPTNDYPASNGRDIKIKTFEIPVSEINSIIKDLKRLETKPKVGDELIMIKNGKKGKVIKCGNDQCDVDFGNGDVYGIVYRRIIGNKITEQFS